MFYFDQLEKSDQRVSGRNKLITHQHSYLIDLYPFLITLHKHHYPLSFPRSLHFFSYLSIYFSLFITINFTYYIAMYKYVCLSMCV